jgi:hypothetical protein
MSLFINAIYTKPGATFATAAEALANKNSLYPPELTQEIQDCYAQMVADGVLWQPVDYTWNQATHTLTVIKNMTTWEDYLAAQTFDGVACEAYSNQAGWTKQPYPWQT